MKIEQQHLGEEHYFPEVHKKDLIVLHFTAGSTPGGAIATFRAKGQVATAYIVDRLGGIIELFPPECWAWHLGLNSASFPNHRLHDQRSIGIEIVNVGPLRLQGQMLCMWPADFTQPYCSVTETDRYVSLAEPWRTFSFFASFSDQQMVAVGELTDMLIERFGIPPVMPHPSKRLEWDPNYFGGGGMAPFRGIAAHHNFRRDKTDVGPAFDWAALQR